MKFTFIILTFHFHFPGEADKVKSLIRLRAELSPLFTGKRNASKYAWAVVERELNVPLPLSKIIKKWNNLLQEYKAIKMSEEPKRREWPFFTLMDVYFSDQVNDPSLRLFSSTKTLTESIDDSVFDDDPIVSSAIAAATSGALMDIEELIKRQKEQKYQMDIKPYNDSSLPHLSNNTCDSVDDRTHMMNKKYSDMKNVSPKHSVINDHFMAQSKAMNDENTKRQIQQTDHSDRSPKIGNTLHMEQQQLLLQQNQNAQQQQQQSGNYIDQNTIDQYLLSWNNFHGNMCRGFHSLQKDEKMVDVTIAAGGKIFKAHKLVLSVCSPYFQQIFLENPSSHPILLMADVESNHMAGLLDFMYSGQVNVKYDDLPVFLKVAEAMKIKGLHTEKSNESEENYSSRDNPQSDTSDLNAKNQQRAHNDSSPLPSCSSPSVKIMGQSNSMNAQQQQHKNQMITDHLKAKSIFAENFAKNLCKPNNNGNSFNKPSNVESSSDILNSSSNCNKILDSRKHSKYFSKRKMYMHFNQTQQDIEEKRAKQCMAQPMALNNNLKSMLSENDEALNLVQSTNNEGLPPQPVVNSSTERESESKNVPTNLSCKDKRDTVLSHSLHSDTIKTEENRPIYSDPHKSFYHQTGTPHTIQMKVEPEDNISDSNNNNNTKSINFNSNNNNIKSSSFYSDDNNNNNTEKVSCNSLDLKDKNNNRQEGINASSKCDQYNGNKF
ncbi:hypothetical protein ACFFRR_006676 [Megaselia abdita]